MKRRNFLRLSTLSSLALGVPFLSGCRGSLTNTAIAEPVFLMHIFDKKTLIDTGKWWLSKNPADNSKSKIEGFLTLNSSIGSSTPVAKVHDYFDQKTREDFEKKRVTVVDGWVLSDTETLQCALYALVED